MERARKRYKKAKANSHEDVTKEEFQEEIQYILRNLYEEFIEPDDDTKADRRKRGDSEEKLTRDKSDAITLFHKIAKDADIVHDPPANAAGEQDAEMLRGWRAMLYREQQARADSDENESVAGESVYGGLPKTVNLMKREKRGLPKTVNLIKGKLIGKPDCSSFLAMTRLRRRLRRRHPLTQGFSKHVTRLGRRHPLTQRGTNVITTHY